MFLPFLPGGDQRSGADHPLVLTEVDWCDLLWHPPWYPPGVPGSWARQCPLPVGAQFVWQRLKLVALILPAMIGTLEDITRDGWKENQWLIDVVFLSSPTLWATWVTLRYFEYLTFFGPVDGWLEFDTWLIGAGIQVWRDPGGQTALHRRRGNWDTPGCHHGQFLNVEAFTGRIIERNKDNKGLSSKSCLATG